MRPSADLPGPSQVTRSAGTMAGPRRVTKPRPAADVAGPSRITRPPGGDDTLADVLRILKRKQKASDNLLPKKPKMGEGLSNILEAFFYKESFFNKGETFKIIKLN